MDTERVNNNQYKCCFCRHFQLAGYRWGYCDLLNVYVRGDLDACQVSIPPFANQENLSPTESQTTNCQGDLSLKT